MSRGEPLRIWCDLSLVGRARQLLADGVAPHVLLPLRASGGAPASLAGADVAFGQPDPRHCGEAAHASRLAWVHLSTAGYTAYDVADVRAALARRGTALTTSSSVFAEPCAQHALAFMLADTRQLGRSLRHQLGDRAWAQEATRAASVLLRDQTVVLVGVGAIARRLAELLAPFGVELAGVRRTPRGDEPFAVAPLAELDAWLGRADHVVSTLPASESTTRLFDAARFAAMRPSAAFYNIGRGSTVDTAALLAALAGGQLRAAYLDVTDPEPLPADHPLWAAANCTITPHAAGGHAGEHERLVRHFLENLRRYQTGSPLLDRVA